jgi:hypothetical protein
MAIIFAALAAAGALQAVIPSPATPTAPDGACHRATVIARANLVFKPDEASLFQDKVVVVMEQRRQPDAGAPLLAQRSRAAEPQPAARDPLTFLYCRHVRDDRDDGA